MALMKMRNKIQQDSRAARSFRGTPTRSKLIGSSALAIVSWLVAAWTYLDGRNALVATIPLVVGMVCAAVAWDTWRRLEP